MRFLPLITLPHLLFLSFYIHNINLSTGRGEGVDCIIFEYRCAGFDFHHNIRAFFDLREYPPPAGILYSFNLPHITNWIFISHSM